jgi:hypothetical protein
MSQKKDMKPTRARPRSLDKKTKKTMEGEEREVSEKKYAESTLATEQILRESDDSSDEDVSPSLRARSLHPVDPSKNW